MKKSFLTALLFLLFINIYSSSNINKDYKKYYEFINNAELLIVENDFFNAHQIYSEAFRQWPKAPSIDYYNALLCAVKSNIYSEAFSYLEILAKKGWELDYFLENPYLSELRKESEWERFVENYPKFNQLYTESLDTELLNELANMLIKDQSLAKSNRYNEYLKTVISNADRIYELIYKNQTNNIHFGSVYSILYSPFPVVLLRHYCGIYNEVQKGYIDVSKIINDTLMLVNLEDALLKEIENGNLSPLVYDLAVTYSNDANLYGNDLFLEVDTVIIRRKIEIEEEKQINEKRLKIGQEPIRDYIKKLEFKSKKIDENLEKYFFKFRISSSYTLIKGNPERLKSFIEDRLNEGWVRVTP